MILYFNEEERVEIILKVEAKMLEVKIKTLIYESNENHFHVKYQLIEANEEVEYIIDSDEVKE